MQNEEPRINHSELSSSQDPQFTDSQPQDSSTCIVNGLPKRQLSIEQPHIPNKKPFSSVHSLPHPAKLDSRVQETTIVDDKPEHVPINSGNILQQQQSLSLGSNMGYDGYDKLVHHHQQASVNNGQQIINVYNTTVKNNIAILAPQQRQPDFAGVRSALESYYQRHLKIQLVSGKPLDFEKCYGNLAMVEAIHQQQADRYNIDNQLEYFKRMKTYENVGRTNLKSRIKIEKLFNRRNLQDGRLDIPKKILIQGRAGIGKTTLCKKTVHQFINGRWHDRFEAVLWIPLRQLKIYRPQSIEDLVKAKFIPQLSNKNKSLLADDLSTGIELERVLFILDGLDEVIQDIQTDIVLNSFLCHLMQQTHVIITSRPSGVNNSILPALDLELETVGFSKSNIKKYVNSVLDEEAATSVMGFIKRTPILQSLAHIPVQLDVICHSWKSLPKEIESITLTKLYQIMVNKLLCNDVTRIGKTDNGRVVSIQLMSRSNELRVRNMVPDEIEYLTYLAFDGIRNHRIEFDYSKLDEIVDELNDSRVQTNRDYIPLDLLEILKQTSFLHSVKDTDDDEDDPTQRSYHFIHLTFQEYFASLWLSNHLQTNTPISSSSTTVETFLHRDEAMQFIQMNKYNPRCEIIWWMVAGQLDGEALESYFQLLQSPPRDLIGVRHQSLISGCYKESRYRLPDKLVNQIESDISLWYRFERKKSEKHSYDSDFNCLKDTIPGDIYFKLVKEHGSNDLSPLVNFRRPLIPTAPEQLIPLLLHEDSGARKVASEALSRNSTLSESAISAIVANLQNQDSSIRFAAAGVLGRQSMMSESTVASLQNTLQDQDSNVRRQVINSLGRQSSMSETTLAAIISKLQDQDRDVRSAAIGVLGIKSPMSETTLAAIIDSLQDTDSNVQYAAVNVLGKQAVMTESIITALITTIQDQRSKVRAVAVSILGNQSFMTESILSAIVTALQDQSSYVRQEAIKALVNQCKMSESNGVTIIPSDLRDRYSSFLHLADKVPCDVQTMPGSSISAFIAALEDQDSDIRELAIITLEDQMSLTNIPDTLITALNISLQDQNPNVRSGAAQLLRRQTRAIKSEIETPMEALLNQNPRIREMAISTISKQSPLSESTLAALLNTLKDQDPRVRREAIYALGRQPSMSESTLVAITSTLQDQDLGIRGITINTLGRQPTTSKLIIKNLGATLRDHCPFYSGRIEYIGEFNQETIFKLILSQIIPVKGSDCGNLGRPESEVPETTRTVAKNNSTRHNIETLYTNFLFHYSVKYHLTLCIYGNQLHMYTGQGFQESEDLSKEDLRELEGGFVAAQRSGGIEIDFSFSRVG